MIHSRKFTTVAAVALLMVSIASAQAYESVFDDMFSPVSAEQDFFQQAPIFQQPPIFQQANNAFYQDQDQPTVRGQILDGGPLLPEHGGGWMSDFFANGYFIFAGDAWENRLDDDYGNNFGFRIGWNQSFPAFGAIRGQFGISYGVYDLSGRDTGGGVTTQVAEQVENHGTLTLGLYKRSDVANCNYISWGLVYDQRFANNVGEEAKAVKLGQFRGQAGYAISEFAEWGMKFSLRADEDFLQHQARIVPVHALDQLTIYWTQNWETGLETELLLGVAEEPGAGVFGFNATAPATEYFGVFGNFYYIIPSTRGGDAAPINNAHSEQYFNVTFGIIYYPGEYARPTNISGFDGVPLIGLPDNGTFAIEAPNGSI